ncbi:MAG TPA: zeta toxin family protein [Kofleriaceae bacterium]|nr:zeta toxin family protein [Kofleriaceae bacterium]
MKPEMIVIAGPSGSGKSRYFAARRFGIAFFNVDDRCAELNGGSYRRIPVELRAQAQHECARFIDSCTANGTSFAVETTLRSAIAIEQALRARTAGFALKMVFVATEDVHQNAARVARRGLRGGHSAPTARIVEIYERSLANLRRALATFDEVEVYDNSIDGANPRLVQLYREGRVIGEWPPRPAWLAAAVDRY